MGVDVTDYSCEADGVKWVATWDGQGSISYKADGKNAEGKTPDVPPAEVIAKAREHGKKFGSNEEKPKEGEELGNPLASQDKLGELVVKTYADGTLETNIPESQWTERQREFVEICRKTSEMQNASKGNANAQTKGMKVDGKNEPDMGKKRDEKRKLLDEFKKEFKALQYGMLQDVEMFKESVVGSVKDLYKGMKLLGKGKFRELRDRLGLRIHDNLQAMGILPTNMEEKLQTANKKIEERLGYNKDNPRIANPNLMARRIGDTLRHLKKLSGREGVVGNKLVKKRDISGQPVLVPVSRRDGYGSK